MANLTKAPLKVLERFIPLLPLFVRFHAPISSCLEAALASLQVFGLLSTFFLVLLLFWYGPSAEENSHGCLHFLWFCTNLDILQHTHPFLSSFCLFNWGSRTLFGSARLELCDNDLLHSRIMWRQFSSSDVNIDRPSCWDHALTQSPRLCDLKLWSRLLMPDRASPSKKCVPTAGACWKWLPEG